VEGLDIFLFAIFVINVIYAFKRIYIPDGEPITLKIKNKLGIKPPIPQEIIDQEREREKREMDAKIRRRNLFGIREEAEEEEEEKEQELPRITKRKSTRSRSLSRKKSGAASKSKTTITTKITKVTKVPKVTNVIVPNATESDLQTIPVAITSLATERNEQEQQSDQKTMMEMISPRSISTERGLLMSPGEKKSKLERKDETNVTLDEHDIVINIREPNKSPERSTNPRTQVRRKQIQKVQKQYSLNKSQ